MNADYFNEQLIENHTDFFYEYFLSYLNFV